MSKRALGLLGNVDLSILQALDQIFRREIDKFDIVGPVKEQIGNRLTNSNPHNMGNYVVQAFDVLNINGRVDIDPRFKSSSTSK